jgi:hypothetical protein
MYTWCSNCTFKTLQYAAQSKCLSWQTCKTRSQSGSVHVSRKEGEYPENFKAEPFAHELTGNSSNDKDVSRKEGKYPENFTAEPAAHELTGNSSNDKDVSRKEGEYPENFTAEPAAHELTGNSSNDKDVSRKEGEYPENFKAEPAAHELTGNSSNEKDLTHRLRVLKQTSSSLGKASELFSPADSRAEPAAACSTGRRTLVGSCRQTSPKWSSAAAYGRAPAHPAHCNWSISAYISATCG